MTADLTSCQPTRSHGGAPLLPHLVSLYLAIHPSIITVRTSSFPAAQSQSPGAFAASHASPTLRTVVIALSSPGSQPHAPQTFAAFSNDPVSHTVVTILRSSAGETAPRSPRKRRSRKGVSHLRVDLHCPHGTESLALPSAVSTSMPMRLVRLSLLPSEPSHGIASAISWSRAVRSASPLSIDSPDSRSSTSASACGARPAVLISLPSWH